MSWADLEGGIPIFWGNSHDFLDSSYATSWRPEISLEKEVPVDEMDFEAEAARLRKIADNVSKEQEREREARRLAKQRSSRYVKKSTRRPLTKEERQLRERDRHRRRYHTSVKKDRALMDKRLELAKEYQKRVRETETPEERELRLELRRRRYLKKKRVQQTRDRAHKHYHNVVKNNPSKLEAKRERDRNRMQEKRKALKAQGITPWELERARLAAKPELKKKRQERKRERYAAKKLKDEASRTSARKAA